MNNEEIKMSYLAGVMDGDGSFGIHKLSGATDSSNPLYFPILQCSTWRSFIHILKETFGGHVVKGKVHVCKDGSLGHALYRWKLRSAKNVKPVLEKLIPFLIIKKERAEFLLDFINKNPFSRGRMMSNQIVESRERAYIKMVQMNDWTSCVHKMTSNLSRQMNENFLFWSYVAGLMDTDGSFAIKKQTRNQGTHVINPRYLPVISLSMTDIRAINYVRENCNVGKLYIPNNKSTNSGFHYQYGIYTKKECIEFLKRIIPFLISKKENASTLLEFCEKSENTLYCKAGISEKELSFREECHQKMKSLNKYGVLKPSLIDLEAREGDRAEGESHGERLSEMALQSDAIV